MESILRACILYFFLLIILRISGSRTLSELTLFDFVLLLIIGDSTQQAIVGNDYSITNAILVISTLVCIDFILTFLKSKFPVAERILEGKPIIIVDNGKVKTKIIKQLRINYQDILESGRRTHGLESITDIKYAILEKDGNISIIPNK